jgi:PAS domain S-box-containing protein
MSLRFKSLLIFAVAVSLLFGILIAFAKIVIERQFTEIEMEQMSGQARQFSAELDEELAPILSTGGDWATRDDLYDYASGRNPGFPARYLLPGTLGTLHLDFLGVFRQSGDLLFLSTIPEPVNRAKLGGEQFISLLHQQNLIPQEDIRHPAAGLALAGDQLLFVAALPIVRGDRPGAPTGTIVLGRAFVPDRTGSSRDHARFHVKFLPLSPGSLVSTAAPHSSTARIVDEQQIEASVPLVDLRGRQIATAELASDRPLHVQAARTIRIFVICLASAAGILLFIVWYLLDANVIDPVHRLASRLTETGNRSELPFDLGFKGSSEIADLAHRIEDLALTIAQTEANYRAIVEDQTEFIFRYLPDGRLTFANGALCRYFGLSREKLAGLDVYRLVADEDSRRIRDAVEGLTVTAPVVTLDHRVIAPAGSSAHTAPDIIWFNRTDRAIFSPDGALRELQCVARDITQNHLTHARLEASEIRYRRLFETATDGIVIVRKADHTITDANPALCRLLDSARSALLGQRLQSLEKFKRPKTLRSLLRLLENADNAPVAELILDAGENVRLYFEVSSRIYETNTDTIVQLTFRDVSQRRRATEELRELSGHLLRSQDEERRRIARELHDSTAQLLTAQQMALTQLAGLDSDTTLGNERTSALLDEIRSLTDSSLREIRTLSYLLHPPLLDEVGLLFALRWYVNGFMTRTEIIVRLDAPESLDRLRPDIETAIFRVVQEGLGNIHRHSGSRRAWIHLALENGIITLEIRDEGRGLPPSHPPGYPVLGVGIAGMRERMRQFNGSLTIESSGQGTTVRATLPLEPDARPDSSDR